MSYNSAVSSKISFADCKTKQNKNYKFPIFGGDLNASCVRSRECVGRNKHGAAKVRKTQPSVLLKRTLVGLIPFHAAFDRTDLQTRYVHFNREVSFSEKWNM